MKEVKKNKYCFFMLKSVFKCIESIRIKKKWVKNNQILKANLGGGGVQPSWSKANFSSCFNTSLMQIAQRP